MLYIRIGEDEQKRLTLAKEFADIDVVLGKGEMSGIRQYLASDMWGGVLKIRLDNWNNEEDREWMYKYLEEMSASANVFLIDETNILDATFKKIQKHATKSVDARVIEEKLSAFTLGDLILRGDKRGAWLEYWKLIKWGEPAESIVGAINYKFKLARRDDLIFKTLDIQARGHDSRGDIEKELEIMILGI